MTNDRILEFWQWAETEREIQGLSWYIVEQKAGMSNASISKRARDILAPTERTCQGIAEAFNIPPEEVFRRAGLLPQESAETRAKRAIRHLAEQMSDEELDLWNDIGRALLERRNRQTD